MQMKPEEARTLGRVLGLLGSGVTSQQHFEDFLIGYQILGRLVAVAQGEAEQAEMDRKVEWSKAFALAKSVEGKPSDRVCEAQADISVEDLRKAEIKARTSYTKLRHTRESVWEAIQALKYLGRTGG